MRSEVQPGVELIPSPTAIVRTYSEAEFKREVQKQVAVIMAERDEAVVMEPFFRSRQIAYELKRLQTVPEQRKWSAHYERYGCLICQTKDSIHVGCGMCNTCYARTFNALQQIIAEGVTGKPAQPAHGATRTDRLLPVNRPMDAAHHTFDRRCTKDETRVYGRVAEQCGVSVAWVRRVAHGEKRSRYISNALKEEAAKYIGISVNEAAVTRKRSEGGTA